MAVVVIMTAMRMRKMLKMIIIHHRDKQTHVPSQTLVVMRSSIGFDHIITHGTISFFTTRIVRMLLTKTGKLPLCLLSHVLLSVFRGIFD